MFSHLVHREMLRVLVLQIFVLCATTFKIDDDFMPMPGGHAPPMLLVRTHCALFVTGWLIHRSCIHDVAQTGGAVDPGLDATPCPFPRRRVDATAVLTKPTPVGYYSDWAVYAVDARAAGFSSMSSHWTVPPKPKKRGPAGLSSIYIFNGLEDGGGHHGNATLILQPVLQYGKSGCVRDPLLWGSWHLSAYYVSGAGRAYCGSLLRVNEGDVVVGQMKMSPGNKWKVSANKLGSSDVSSVDVTLSVQIDAAYATLEGMIIYNCEAYPGGNGTKFESNQLIDSTGATVTPRWTPMVRHSECGQKVTSGSGGDVTLHYDASK